jgi:hypothetical protein
VGYNTVYRVESQPTFRRNMSLPSSGSQNTPSKKPARNSCSYYLLMLVSWLASSTLKMEATCSVETSVDLQPTTGRYIPEVRILHNRPCEDLRPCSKFCGFISKYLKFSLYFTLYNCCYNGLDFLAVHTGLTASAGLERVSGV